LNRLDDLTIVQQPLIVLAKPQKATHCSTFCDSTTSNVISFFVEEARI